MQTVCSTGDWLSNSDGDGSGTNVRGYGESAGTTNVAAYSWRELSRDICSAWPTPWGIARFAAGGASMGCATVIEAAVAAPDRIDPHGGCARPSTRGPRRPRTAQLAGRQRSPPAPRASVGRARARVEVHPPILRGSRRRGAGPAQRGGR